MPSDKPRYTLRVPPELLKKMEYIAQYNGRTKNKEIEKVIKDYAAAFESEYGPIVFDEDGNVIDNSVRDHAKLRDIAKTMKHQEKLSDDVRAGLSGLTLSDKEGNKEEYKKAK